MPLTLRITNEAGLRYGALELSKTFDEQGGTIGRADGNDWILPDPERHLSARHAAIYFQDGAFWLADTSANGVFVNGATEAVGPDRPLRLNDGDRLEMGDYEVAAALGASNAAPPPPADDAIIQPLPSAAVAGDATAHTLDPLELLQGKSAPAPASANALPAGNAQDPLALLAGAATAAANPAAGRPQPAGPPSGSPIIPETLDPLELLGGAPTGNPVTAPPTAPPAGTGAEPDHAPMMESHFSAPKPAFEPIPEDWNAAPDAAAPPRAAPQSPAASAVPAPHPTVVQEPRPPVPSAMPAAGALEQTSPGQPSVSGASDHGTALRAFFEGAGLDANQANVPLDDDMARMLGGIFRQVVADLREVLMSRSELKSGFQMSMTTIAPRENNPIKFSAGGVDEALGNLLMRRSPGYLPAEQAFKEAFEDIKSHHIAVIAGMRASLASLLARFDPQSLEAHFTEQSGRGSLFASRGAKNWNFYQDYYRDMVKEAEENFQKLFGEEFGKAYEEQTRTLGAERKPPER